MDLKGEFASKADLKHRLFLLFERQKGLFPRSVNTKAMTRHDVISTETPFRLKAFTILYGSLKTLKCHSTSVVKNTPRTGNKSVCVMDTKISPCICKQFNIM